MAYHSADLNDGPTAAAAPRSPSGTSQCASGRRVGYGCLRFQIRQGKLVPSEGQTSPPAPTRPAIQVLADGNARCGSEPQIKILSTSLRSAGGCADSRLLAAPVRQEVCCAGNIAESPTNISGLEFGRGAEVEGHCVVLGIRQCGAVQSV